jgi:hypothetical protein
MIVEINKGRLIISLKPREPKASKSGKNLLVASTRGVNTSSVKVSGRTVRVTAHAFIHAVPLKKRP